MAITSNPKQEAKKPAPKVLGPEEIDVDPKQEAKAQVLATQPMDGKTHDHVIETSNPS
jgi:hypothetical protein